MCAKKKLFYELDESVRSKVAFGNKSKVSILGKNKMFVQLKNGNHNFIYDVFYVPKRHPNWVSMGKFVKKEV